MSSQKDLAWLGGCLGNAELSRYIADARTKAARRCRRLLVRGEFYHSSSHATFLFERAQSSDAQLLAVQLHGAVQPNQKRSKPRKTPTTQNNPNGKWIGSGKRSNQRESIPRNALERQYFRVARLSSHRRLSLRERFRVMDISFRGVQGDTKPTDEALRISPFPSFPSVPRRVQSHAPAIRLN